MIGLGRLGRWHAEKYAASAQAELVAVCDQESEHAHRVASELGAQALEFGALLEVVEAVSLAVPASQHFSLAWQILMADRHLLVEKPITHRLSEAQQLLSLARHKNLQLWVGHVERFNPAFQALQGPLTGLSICRRAPPSPRGRDVSVILDLMIHDLDLLLSRVETPIQSLEAQGGGLEGRVDQAWVQICFSDGLRVRLEADRLASKGQRLWRLPGRRLDLRSRGLSRAGRPTLEFPKADPLADQVEAFLRGIDMGAPQSPWGALRALKLALEVEALIQTQERSPYAASSGAALRSPY